jgi:hypothetical protein
LNTQHQQLGRLLFSLREGYQLEEAAREHFVKDCDPEIGFLKRLEIQAKSLGEKIKSAMREERAIEERRKEFMKTVVEANNTRGSIQTLIRSLAYESLETLSSQQRELGQQRSILKKNQSDVNDSWIRLCELRVLSELHDPQSFNREISDIFTLCDQTATKIDATITRLKQQAV